MSKSPIAAMFDRISPSYDRLNHMLSLSIDKVWRRRTSKTVSKHQPGTILDLATGTADLALLLAKKNPQAHIIGMDISEKMMEIGKAKINNQGLEKQIELRFGNAVSLPFENNTFDAVTCAFGVRNFENLEKGLSEISRVTKSGGKVYILEFSMPKRFPVKHLYRIYFKNILPKIGRAVSKDEGAYSYLPSSVEQFPKPKDFQQMLLHHDLANCKVRKLTFGIVMLYTATKA